MSKRNIFLWALYDFANSVVMIVFFLYFSQWLVVDNSVSDAWYNALFIFSTILLILTAPIVSVLADKSGKCFSFLRKNTVVVWILYILLSLLILFTPEQKVLAMTLFVLGNFAYQLSFTFYHPLLNELAPEEKRGWISGIGNASNWLGQITGLILVLPFIKGGLYLFGEPGRAQVFLPATIGFILLSLPMMLFFRKEETLQMDLGFRHLKEEYKNVFKQIKTLWVIPGVSMFLIAFFFFNDAILTASNNFPIVLERVFQAPDAKKTLLLALILLTSAVGSILCGYLGDRFGLKRVLNWILFGWIIIFPLIGLSPNIEILTVWVTIMGILFGGVWAVSRALLSRLIPKEQLNYGFSFYIISERFASFLGPLVWSGIVVFTSTANNLNYRIAMVSMTAFIIIGLLLMKKVEYQNL
ncbi:hypothetical protein A2824_03705 [Candidatus Nomurabacteria bacterium RIFCSPHIGHO2_01_FULL_42_16]|uniref:Major facilitator superfamily (MFS) profile domain-containing protein n=1 Tax=Candidatus Nomurabacteria bacterium RIFCSPHIGHO2_01_FULL_42_16 TaxID=1801743 RepID=A0A1F6VIX3_9BACT|nr:MAG: hypothetical protein A2824_03705 [Candidatus Nomurabacteria bacterium RIFCSPHIGHO2_01_FULL_42_16]